MHRALFALVSRPGRSLSALALAFAIFGGAADVSASPAADAGARQATPSAAEEGAFDREAAAAAMKDVDVGRCKRKKGPTGEGHVAVTFASSGAVKDAVVDRPPFAGTKVGACVAKAFRQAKKIPAFKGDRIVVGKTFHLD